VTVTTPESARLRAAAAPRFGDHLPAPPGTLTIDLATVLGVAGDVPDAEAPSTFGPLGFTRAVVPILRAFTSSHYMAVSYSMGLFGKKPRRNDDSGSVDFAGCTAKQARAASGAP